MRSPENRAACTAIISRLKARFPHIAAPPKDDICYATQNRQEAVSKLAAEAQLTLVLGSQNSSNSQRLAELSAERGVPAHLIDGPADINATWFAGVETVLVNGRQIRTGGSAMDYAGGQLPGRRLRANYGCG